MERVVHSAIPPRVEYNLTPLGSQATDKLADLVLFLEAQMPGILAAQDRYDAADGAA